MPMTGALGRRLAYYYVWLGYLLAVSTIAYAVGFLLAFWVTPHVTVGHVVFATAATVYILVGTRLEERDLEAAFDGRYRTYRGGVPMFLPRPSRQGFSPAEDEP